MTHADQPSNAPRTPSPVLAGAHTRACRVVTRDLLGAILPFMGRLRVDRLAGPPAVLATAGGVLVARRCYRAASWPARLTGLLATPDLAGDEALWLEPCASVHTLGMRVPIGCAFLDGEGRVLRVVDPLPARRAAAVRGARAVVRVPRRGSWLASPSATCSARLATQI